MALTFTEEEIVHITSYAASGYKELKQHSEDLAKVAIYLAQQGSQKIPRAPHSIENMTLYRAFEYAKLILTKPDRLKAYLTLDDVPHTSKESPQEERMINDQEVEVLFETFQETLKRTWGSQKIENGTVVSFLLGCERSQEILSTLASDLRSPLGSCLPICQRGYIGSNKCHDMVAVARYDVPARDYIITFNSESPFPPADSVANNSQLSLKLFIQGRKFYPLSQKRLSEMVKMGIMKLTVFTEENKGNIPIINYRGTYTLCQGHLVPGSEVHYDKLNNQDLPSTQDGINLGWLIFISAVGLSGFYLYQRNKKKT